jgi:phage tail-like protein
MSGSGFLLGGGYPWRSLSLDGAGEPASVIANDRLGLSLASLRSGSRGLESPDDSLGGLTLPRGVAVSGTTVFMLSTAGDLVYRYDPAAMAMTPLREVGRDGLSPNPGDLDLREPRRFAGATNIAAFGMWLWVADTRARRVQVFNAATLALVGIHEGFDAPIDVAAGPDGAYILDGAVGRVLRDRPGVAELEVVVEAPYRGGRWDRIAVDGDGGVYLRDHLTQPPVLDVFDPPHRDRRPRSVRVASSDAVRERFATPCVRTTAHGQLMLSGELLDPCGLRRAARPAESSWTVEALRYVIARDARMIRVQLLDGRERSRFGPFNAAGGRVSADSSDAWRPVDLTAIDRLVFVLDERHQSVHVHRPDAEILERRFTRPADHPRRWARIATDGNGCLLLWDGSAIVDRLDPSGRLLGQEPRAVFVAAQRPSDARVVPPKFTITRDGLRPPAAKPEWPELTFERHGVWVSEWLDSGIYNCQWDRIVVSLGALPPGATATLRTRSASTPTAGSAGDPRLADALGNPASWQASPAIVADPQPLLTPEPLEPIEHLVQSGPGQYLQLQIELTADGVRVPVIDRIRVTMPRESWLPYLPATYSQPDDQREFLERYLAIAQTTWSELEAQLESFERHLDPVSVPEEQLAYLASWLDLTLEGTLAPDQNRQILAELPRLWRTWGTVAGVRAWVRVHLAALSGAAVQDIERAGLPGIVEAFVDRRSLWLGRADTSTLSPTEALWSPSVERRFQVGVFDRAGEVELVSAGDPELDVFRRYAHKFRVYVPAIWVRTAAAEALLRRAIDLQRPAHTTFDLVLVEPRFRVGDQSTIALDTVVGGQQPWHLDCPDETVDSPYPAHRLGYDTVVSGVRQTANGPGAVLR